MTCPRVLGTFEIGAGNGGAITADGDDRWIRSARRFLEHVAPDGSIIAAFEADVTSGGDVVVAHGAVWTTAFDDAALFRLGRS